MPATNSNPDNGKPVSSYAKYSGMAIQMVVIIGIFSYAGYKIDEHAGHKTQWVTAALSLLGVFISLFIILRSLKN